MKHKIQMVIHILLILFMPLMMYVHIAETKVNLSIADGLLVLVTLSFLINIKEFFRNRIWIYLLYFMGLLLSLLISQWMSVRNDVFHHVGTSVMLMEMVKTLVVTAYFFSALIFVQHEKGYRLAWITVSLSSIPVMLIGFSSYFYFLQGKEFPFETFQIKNNLRFLGTFEDPNLAALYFILVFFISLSNFVFIRNRLLRWLMFAISCFSLIAIFLTMSRGGWVAWASGMLVFLIYNWKFITKKSLINLLLVMILALLSINIDLMYQEGRITNTVVHRIQSSVSSELDDIDRVQLTKTAIQMGNDNFWFGVGKGSFPLNITHYAGEDSRMVQNQHIPHNTLAGVYAQQGILGLLAFISLPGYILYRLICSKRRESYYFIPLLIAFVVHSLSINIENVRFIWYILGLILAGELRGISMKAIPSVSFTRKTYALVLASLFIIFLFLYVDVSRKWATPIYVYKGNVYEKQIKVPEPGEYILSFDVQTDAHRHKVDVYDGETFVETKEFEAARGVVQMPLQLKNGATVAFRSHEDGWMRIYNSYLTNDKQSIPLYNYLLLPDWAEGLFQRKNGLVHLPEELSFKSQFVVNDNVFDTLTISNARVIRYSNLSHVYEFDMQLEEAVNKNYQLVILLDYASIADLFPSEYQRNLWTFGFTIYPLTSTWEPGTPYTVRTNALYSSEQFQLYGRYRNSEDQVYTQESYFPISYDVIKHQQEMVALGESQWIHVGYDKDEKGRIVMKNNGWVESPRMNLEAGSYEITFKAQGSYYKEFSRIRIRDNSLETVAELTLDDTMKEYTVENYHTDQNIEGGSFVLELINYDSENDVGNRIVYLDDTLSVVRK